MIKWALFILLFLAFKGCNQDETNQNLDKGTPEGQLEMIFDTVYQGAMTMYDTDFSRNKSEIVIRSQDELERAWGSDTNLPDIDFEKNMLIIVSMGEQPSSGYEIEVKSIEASGDNLVINVLETKPGDTCMALTVITNPIHIVKISASELSPFFSRETQIIEC